MRIFTLVIGLLLSLPSLANWQLSNEKSQFNFISTKAINSAEVHHFTQLSGTLSSEGAVQLSIDLTSVESNIAVRNERMQKFLFQTNLFPQASFTASVDTPLIKKLKVGELTTIDLTGEINLHGVKQRINTQVHIVKLKADELLVNSVKPIIIQASAFNLSAGVEKLQALAGLPSISEAVPVTFSFVFIK